MRNVGDDMGMGDGSGLDEAGLDGLRADDLRTPPRELVVASAGAGKTYRLSTRIIELLAAGAPPEEIFASTFTRKAAGEILERVLLRLAEGGQAPVGMKDPELSQEACIRLLELLLPRLHAVNVGTLDSFFQRMARAFSLELGFPPAWTLSDGPTEARLQGDAVTRLLGSTDTGGVLELLRLLQAGEARRGVHDALVDEVGQLHDTFQELDPNVPDPWGFPETNERAADQEGPSDRTPVTLLSWIRPPGPSGRPRFPGRRRESPTRAGRKPGRRRLNSSRMGTWTRSWTAGSRGRSWRVPPPITGRPSPWTFGWRWREG